MFLEYNKNILKKVVLGIFLKFRPYGVATLIAGFDTDRQPRLFQTDPSGSCTEWKASVIGRNNKEVLTNLEKNYEANLNLQGVLFFIFL